MRILASVILLSLALNLPVSAKAMTEKVSSRKARLSQIGKQVERTSQKLKVETNKIEKSNKKSESDGQTAEKKKNKIASANDNFVASTYISETTSRDGKKVRKANSGKKYELPSGSFTVNASAYTAAADECGKSDGITASGVKVHRGTLACPPNFPFGTKIALDGMGTFVCEDRGGAIKGNHVDIYMPTKKEAFAFGRRNITASVIQ